jgi:hypothetical protein|tara:strand:+ start:97 stop:216 length:120 start_codon:yes stop_codon:yes gene_type:complete
MKDLRWVAYCLECFEVPQTNLNFDGRCVGCIAYMIEDCV